ncbi:MAG TPA: hypothetical protein VGK44_04330 [Casimicrobiaceae bacterium]|jgi:hypothetical protein
MTSTMARAVLARDCAARASGSGDARRWMALRRKEDKVRKRSSHTMFFTGLPLWELSIVIVVLATLCDDGSVLSNS